MRLFNFISWGLQMFCGNLHLCKLTKLPEDKAYVSFSICIIPSIELGGYTSFFINKIGWSFDHRWSHMCITTIRKDTSKLRLGLQKKRKIYVQQCINSDSLLQVQLHIQLDCRYDNNGSEDLYAIFLHHMWTEKI